MLENKIVLGRDDEEGGKVAFIDFVRGLSILFIILIHIDAFYVTADPPIIDRLMSPFTHCTRLFFFCSGFGLYYSWLRHPLTYGQFLKKRFWKIYVPYILVVAVCALFFLTPTVMTTHLPLS